MTRLLLAAVSVFFFAASVGAEEMKIYFSTSPMPSPIAELFIHQPEAWKNYLKQGRIPEACEHEFEESLYVIFWKKKASSNTVFESDWEAEDQNLGQCKKCGTLSAPIRLKESGGKP